jgi:hypothetical protein
VLISCTPWTIKSDERSTRIMVLHTSPVNNLDCKWVIGIITITYSSKKWYLRLLTSNGNSLLYAVHTFGGSASRLRRRLHRGCSADIVMQFPAFTLHYPSSGCSNIVHMKGIENTQLLSAYIRLDHNDYCINIK